MWLIDKYDECINVEVKEFINNPDIQPFKVPVLEEGIIDDPYEELKEPLSSEQDEKDIFKTPTNSPVQRSPKNEKKYH
jgi:hypothetical protein